MIISLGVFFFFFHFFKILIFWVVRGVKGQKTVQNDKKQEPYMIWLSFMVHMCKMIISGFFHPPYLRNHTSFVSCDCQLWYFQNEKISRNFLLFFKYVIFWVIGVVKEQKTVQNDNKLWVLHLISQEPYIIWFSYCHICMVHMCKMIIYPGTFFNFLKLWFSGLSGEWKGWHWPPISRHFFHFFKILIYVIIRGEG